MNLFIKRFHSILFSIETYIVRIQWNCLGEVIQLSASMYDSFEKMLIFFVEKNPKQYGLLSTTSGFIGTQYYNTIQYAVLTLNIGTSQLLTILDPNLNEASGSHLWVKGFQVWILLDCMAVHCTEPLIITLPLSWYDLKGNTTLILTILQNKELNKP